MVKPVPGVSPPVKGAFHDSIPHFGRLFAEHGDVIRWNDAPFPLFFFRNPEHIKTILNDRRSALAKPVFLFSRVKALMGSGTFISSGAKEWGARNPEIAAIFSKTRSAGMTSSLPKCMDEMFDRWTSHSSSRKEPVIDLFSEIKRLLIDYSFREFFSETLGTKLETVEHASHFVVDCFGDPPPGRFPSLRDIRFALNAHFLKRLMGGVIAKHERESRRYDDVVSRLLALRRCGKELSWNNLEVRDELFSTYFGTSNLATAIAWALFHIAVHPDVQERLAQSEPEYLRMVLNESFRLSPPVWGFTRLAEEAIDVDGYLFDAGSVLTLAGYFAHRHPEYWEDAERFNPERFTKAASENRHRYAFFPFGGGPRMCIGRHLAQIIAEPVIAEIIRRYTLRLEGSTEFPLKFGFEVLPVGHVHLAIKAR